MENFLVHIISSMDTVMVEEHQPAILVSILMMLLAWCVARMGAELVCARRHMHSGPKKIGLSASIESLLRPRMLLQKSIDYLLCCLYHLVFLEVNLLTRILLKMLILFLFLLFWMILYPA